MPDTTTLHGFRLDLERMAERLGVAKRKIVQKVTLDLWGGVTERTPVDTGRARANWAATEGGPGEHLLEFPDAKPGSVPAPAPPDVSGITGEKPVYIINNLPYIKRLEEGHSKQAPAGMVKLAIQAEQAKLGADSSIVDVQQ